MKIMQARSRIYETLKTISVLKRQEVNDDCLCLLSNILKKFDEEKVLDALNKLTVKNKFFPDISEIITEIFPPLNEREIGEQISNKVFDAILKFKIEETHEAEKFIGSLGWDAIRAGGGWDQLHCVAEAQQSSAKAQIRDYIVQRINFDSSLKAHLAPQRNIKILDF